MWNAVKGLFASKKFLATLAGLLAVLVGKVGLNISEDQLWQIVALIASFVTGQGIADFAKEKAKIEASNGS